MNSNTTPVRGYYSILQFVPDLKRSEGANIGVVLFCPERHSWRRKLPPATIGFGGSLARNRISS
jgi:hypothetical protein